VNDADAGLQRNVIFCGDADARIRLRFQTPLEGLPTGRVLVLGSDFVVEELQDLHLFDVPTDRLYRSTGPVRGTMTVTINGPPRSQRPDGLGATMPQLRIVGQVCASSLNIQLATNTVETVR